MAYAARADLTPRRIPAAELIQLTDDTNSGVANDQVITDILNEASALIDSYSRIRYTVPLQSSDQVKGLCLDIAEYKLYLRRRRVKDDVKQGYQDAISFLRDVAAGKAALDQPAAAAPQTGAGDVQTTQVDEKFSDDNLGGYIV